MHKLFFMSKSHFDRLKNKSKIFEYAIVIWWFLMCAIVYSKNKNHKILVIPV